ncbi:MAG: gliding motility-associated C-terminal domain-containing protein [Segetibacter sp.]
MKCIILLILVVAANTTTTAQICTGSLGDPIVQISFGFGSNSGVALDRGQTSYEYSQDMCPRQSQYSLITESVNCFENTWNTISGDHTSTDGKGFFMLVNSESIKGNVFTYNVRGLCPGTTYEFAAWVKNALRFSACEGIGVDPDLKLSVETKSGVVLASYNTGSIRKEYDPEWRQIAVLFKSPATETDLILHISNAAPAGCGNVFALDDITLRPCGPQVNAIVSSNGLAKIEVCEGGVHSFLLATNFGSEFINPVFQWQKRSDTIAWQDIAGANSRTYLTPPETTGTSSFRMVISEAAFFALSSCHIYSNEVTVSIQKPPAVQVTSYVYGCIGGSITLLASGANSYIWTGPNGFTSTNQIPVLANIQYAAAGLYKVTGTTMSGCKNTDSTTLRVYPNATAVSSRGTVICEGSSTELLAEGGVRYRWQPSRGLSNDTVPNPTASPDVNTTYSVKVTNQYGCSDTSSIKIGVWKKPVADAGPDLKTRLGFPVVLQGSAKGSDVTWFWTPATDLSAAIQLNPTTNPPQTTTYTLHVTSSHGCGTATDDVLVKVFDKIVVPNAFSPNGDGINDTWNIELLELFKDADIDVFNRYGQVVFHSRGYGTQWNGTRNGNPLPVGTYYYIINLKINKDPVFKGSVTILR